MAGWEPVTYARSTNPLVAVERFGSPTGRDLRFTLRNDTDAAQRFTLRIELPQLGFHAPAQLRAVEEVTGERLSVTVAGSVGMVAATIPAGSTRLISVTG
jgi:hypothetical protein